MAAGLEPVAPSAAHDEEAQAGRPHPHQQRKGSCFPATRLGLLLVGGSTLCSAIAVKHHASDGCSQPFSNLSKRDESALSSYPFLHFYQVLSQPLPLLSIYWQRWLRSMHLSPPLYTACQSRQHYRTASSSSPVHSMTHAKQFWCQQPAIKENVLKSHCVRPQQGDVY